MLKYFIILLSFVASGLSAQNSDFTIKYLHPKTGIPSLISFKSSLTPPNAENISLWMRENLLANQAFKLQFTRSVLGSDGYQHLRFQQYYAQYKVEAGEVILHQKGNSIESLNGLYFPNLDVDLTVNISSEAAIQNALSTYTSAIFMWELPHEQQLLKVLKNNPNASYYPKPELMVISLSDSFRPSDFRLAYRMEIFSYLPYQREFVYVDAKNGKVLQREDQICNDSKDGLAHTKYSGLQNITCDSVSQDTFILFDHSRGKGIHTIDVRIIGLDSSREFIDTDNIWNNVNSFKDEAATDAHWSAEMTYDYYKKFHNRKSYDDSDGLIVNTVHFGKNYVNAVWDGSKANFGDGDGVNYKPLTSIDICAHELTHGVTQYTAGLRYKDESGALNESFSDIFGKCVEHYADSAKFDWFIAGKITLKNKPFRDLSYPPNQGQPKYYGGKNYYSGNADNGGVHTNSGIQNFWYYLLCHGGNGFRETDSLPYTVKAIGMDKVAQIAYLSLSTSLIRESTFIDACYMSIDAAVRLYGENSEEYKQVQLAWYAVGVLNLSELNIQNTNVLASNWKLYPNPAGQEFYVLNPEVFIASKIEILDISGKQIMSMMALPGESIDISNLTSGIYCIRINNTTVLRLIKS